MMNEQRSETTHMPVHFLRTFLGSTISGSRMSALDSGLSRLVVGITFKVIHGCPKNQQPNAFVLFCHGMSWIILLYIISGLNFLNISDSGHIFPSFTPWLENLMTLVVSLHRGEPVVEVHKGGIVQGMVGYKLLVRHHPWLSSTGLMGNIIWIAC